MKGAEVRGQEHKLLLYADNILAVVTDPLTSLPHLIDTIQLYSFSGFFKFSGYTLSTSCYSHMVEKLKLVPKGMTYLEIRLSQDLNELHLLNFNS